MNNQILRSHIQLVDDATGNCCYVLLVTETTKGFRMMAAIRTFMDGRTTDGMRYQRVIRTEEPKVWKELRELV
jgi:hypothetical protein